MKRKVMMIIYVAIVLLIISLPSLGLIFYKEPASTENKILAKKPAVKDEKGNVNIEFLSDMCDYINDHFAYRQEMVTANAMISNKVFGVSSEDMIVAGTDGWLYYSNTLQDYQGTRQVTKRGYYEIIKSLSLMDEYIKSCGGTFILTIPPNKNTLYPQNMPYYYIKIDDNSVFDTVNSMLADTDILYVNIYELFNSYDEVLYHGTDSHWNNKGAAIVHDELMKYTDIPFQTFADKEADLYYDFEGDLDTILYPLARHTEPDYDYKNYFTYYYLSENEDTSFYHIETANDKKDKSLLMFRDSFGNKLLPFMAQEFNYAIFEKTVPYQLDFFEKNNMDVCIFEMVERNLTTLLKYAPVMQAPERTIDDIQYIDAKDEDTYIKAEIYGEYVKISGEINQNFVKDNSDIYVIIEDGEIKTMYEATPANIYGTEKTGYDYGYVLYIKEEYLKSDSINIKVVTKDKDKGYIVYDDSLKY